VGRSRRQVSLAQWGHWGQVRKPIGRRFWRWYFRGSSRPKDSARRSRFLLFREGARLEFRQPVWRFLERYIYAWQFVRRRFGFGLQLHQPVGKLLRGSGLRSGWRYRRAFLRLGLEASQPGGQFFRGLCFGGGGLDGARRGRRRLAFPLREPIRQAFQSSRVCRSGFGREGRRSTGRRRGLFFLLLAQAPQPVRAFRRCDRLLLGGRPWLNGRLVADTCKPIRDFLFFGAGFQTGQPVGQFRVGRLRGRFRSGWERPALVRERFHWLRRGSLAILTAQVAQPGGQGAFQFGGILPGWYVAGLDGFRLPKRRGASFYLRRCSLYWLLAGMDRGAVIGRRGQQRFQPRPAKRAFLQFIGVGLAAHWTAQIGHYFPPLEGSLL